MAKAAAKAAKHALESKEAFAALGFRSGERDAGGIKITETSVVSLVAEVPEIQDLKKALRNAERESALCDALVGAFDHRRSMLSNSVTLYSTDYYQTGDVKQPKIADVESIEAKIARIRKGDKL